MKSLSLTIMACMGFVLSGCATERQWCVTIRAPYLDGIGADSTWAAAKMVGITRLEVGLDAQLDCPHLYDSDDTSYSISTPEQRDVLNKRLAAEGMSIGCFVVSTRVMGPDDEARVLERINQAALAIKQMGCRMLMLTVAITGPRGETIPDEEFIARGQALIRKLDEIAANTDTQMVIENIGYYWNRPEILEPVLKVAKPHRVGLLHDVCNMYWYGYPLSELYAMTERLAPYVRYVHVKNVNYPEQYRERQRVTGWEFDQHVVSIRKGDIDFARVLAIYAKGGYVGDVCIEDDSLRNLDPAGRRNTLSDDVAYLKELIAKLPTR